MFSDFSCLLLARSVVEDMEVPRRRLARRGNGGGRRGDDKLLGISALTLT